MASTRKKSTEGGADTPAPPPVAEPDLKTAAAAYARLASDRKALGDSIEAPQGDLRAAVDTARKALPRLQTLREAITEHLPKQVALLDALDEQIQALWFAEQLVTLTSSAEPGADRFNEIIERARNLRKLLLSAAEPLVLKGLLEEAKVKAIRSGQGHDDLASDLLELAALYNEAWSRVKNKSAAEREEIEEAEKLGQEMQSLLVLRKSDAAKLSPEETSGQRDRAALLLVRTYQELERTAAYVRWYEGDAEKYAPALFKAKRGRPAKAPGEATPAPPSVVAAEAAEADIDAKSDELPPI